MSDFYSRFFLIGQFLLWFLSFTVEITFPNAQLSSKSIAFLPIERYKNWKCDNLLLHEKTVQCLIIIKDDKKQQANFPYKKLRLDEQNILRKKKKVGKETFADVWLITNRC